MKDLSNENVIHIKKDGMQYLQFRKLLEYKDILTHAYSLGKNVSFRTAKPNKEKLSDKEYAKAIDDYDKICRTIDLNYIDIVKTNQEHTDNVCIIKEKINKTSPDINLEEYSKADAMITNKNKLILSTTNADCILLFFFDPNTKTIANTHSGWRGTLQRISVKTVQKMISEFGSKAEDIICCICPSIKKCHFEVDEDVKELFEKEFRGLNTKEYMEKQEKWNIDTIYINQKILEKAGLKKENIIDSGICSVCNSDIIHSYRVEKQGYGLETALIELK